jgi:hypothetical protein
LIFSIRVCAATIAEGQHESIGAFGCARPTPASCAPYDLDWLVHHPKEAGDLQLLITAGIPDSETAMSHSFRRGASYQHRPGDFDSSGVCEHAVTKDAGHDIRFNRAVDCADDRIFRLDRADTKDYGGPVTDRKELAAIKHKC